MSAAPLEPPLGPLLVLTDRRLAARPLVDVVAAAVQGGARTVVLREKDLPTAERAVLADALRPLLEAVGGRLVLAGTSLPGDAVHLSATDAVPHPRPALLGRSCHDAASVHAATSCDWVTVSPVRLTASKPGHGPALGTAGLAALTALPSAPPVYALGGLGPDDVRACTDAGAAGVAVMGGVMRADDPARAVRELLAAVPARAS